MAFKRIALAVSFLVVAALACNAPGGGGAAPPTATPSVPEEAETPSPPPPAESPIPTVILETPTAEPSPTDTPPPTATNTPAVSAGPLDFPVPTYLDNWRELPDGQIEVTIVVHIEGGAPPFTVFHDVEAFETSERDYPLVFTAVGCSALVHTITVASADGQSVSHGYYIPAPWCITPTPP